MQIYDFSEYYNRLDQSSFYHSIRNTPWYHDAVYPRFSEAEFERRHALLRQAMAERGFDCLIVPGGQSNWSQGGGMLWLSGLIDKRSMAQYVVFPREGVPLLVYAMGGAHAEVARRATSLHEVQPAPGGRFADVIVERIKSLGLEQGRIGILDCTSSRAPEYPPDAQIMVLQAGLPAASIEFVPGLFHELARLKSAEEVEAIERAGALAVSALQALIERAAPGVAEYELAAAATRVILAAGGQPDFIRVGSTPGTAPALSVANPLPSHCRLQAGDLVLAQVSAGWQGVTAQVGTPFCVGRPEPALKKFWDIEVMSEELLPRFSQSEYQRRYDLTRNWMADAGLEAVVIYASAYGGDNVRWLTAFAPRHDTYLIWPLAGEPVLFTQLFNHVPNARRVSVIPDVRWGGPDSGLSVVEMLHERGLTRGRLGLVGRVPYQAYLTLSEHLPEVSWVSADQGYRELRLVKSQEELAWLRRGAAFTDAAMAALVEAAAPGVSEHELVAAIEAAYIGAGGEHGIHFLSTTPMDAPQSYVPAQTQTARRLQRGDVIISELSAGVGGYAGQIHRPVAVGRKPTPLYQRLYQVALETYRRIVAVLRPGATVGQVLDAADYIEAQGLTVCDDLLHGYGMGYLPPVLRTRATAHRRQPPEGFAFEENMAIVVQPNVYDPASGAGLQVGNLLVITRAGAESLQTYPMEFQWKG